MAEPGPPDLTFLGAVALAAESADVRARATGLEGPGEAAPQVAPGPFDVVLCHGVLMYLDDVGPVLRSLSVVAADAAVLSLLVRNELAPAMRAGLRGRIGRVRSTRLRQSARPGRPHAHTAVLGADGHPSTWWFADELTTPGVRVPITADSAMWAEAVALGRQVVWAHTYGAAFSEAEGRARDDVRYRPGASERILNQVAVTGMPVGVEYDPDRQAVLLGSGQWRTVRLEVFDYTVGGKKTSPLDRVHTDRWPVEWSREFTELLTVLTRLVSLEPAQADLLERILAGSLLTSETLRDAGTRWPTRSTDRRPDYSAPRPKATPDPLHATNLDS